MTLLLFLLALACLIAAVYLLGFLRGGRRFQTDLIRVRLEGIAGERELHDLTRDAFIAMSDYAERRRQQ